MGEGAVVEDGSRERIGRIDEDRTTAERLKDGNGNDRLAAKGCLLDRRIRRGVEFKIKIALGLIPNEDGGFNVCWQHSR